MGKLMRLSNEEARMIKNRRAADEHRRGVANAVELARRTDTYIDSSGRVHLGTLPPGTFLGLGKHTGMFWAEMERKIKELHKKGYGR